jgi:hypothetical protein
MTLTSTNFTVPRNGFVIGISGGGVKVSPSSGMTVAISSGFYFLGGKQVAYGGGTKAISAAHATLNRYDVIGIDSAGTIFVKEGTPAASPSVPIARDDLLLLAVITIAAADTSIDTADITDVRNIGGVSVDGTTISVSTGGVASVVASGITGFPSILASGQGNTSVVGNGADQTVFTDSFTAPSNGDTIIVYMKESFSRTAGAAAGNSYTPKLGSTNLLSQAFTDGSFRVQESRSAAGTGNRGYFFAKEIQDGTTGTAAETVITNSTSSYGALPTTVSLLANIPIGTTYNIEYSYCVVKFNTGI